MNLTLTEWRPTLIVRWYTAASGVSRTTPFCPFIRKRAYLLGDLVCDLDGLFVGAPSVNRPYGDR